MTAGPDQHSDCRWRCIVAVHSCYCTESFTNSKRYTTSVSLRIFFRCLFLKRFQTHRPFRNRQKQHRFLFSRVYLCLCELNFPRYALSTFEQDQSYSRHKIFRDQFHFQEYRRISSCVRPLAFTPFTTARHPFRTQQRLIAL